MASARLVAHTWDPVFLLGLTLWVNCTMQLCRWPGTNTPEDEIQQQSGFSFGVRVGVHYQPGEAWAVYNPNLPGDRNNDVMAKVYFER